MTRNTSIRSYHVVIDAPAEAIFDFVNEVSNLPRWAIHFCKGLRLVEGGAMVTTSTGELYFGVTGDRDLGVLDWWAGPDMQSAERWPTRVVGLPDGRSLYQVTALLTEPLPPNIDQLFADELGMLKKLVEEQPVAA
ncbi:MAG TPA: hypothetical protein VFT29_15255 [Gemmatimonadaceae bacterium]|nr:hypothetical protein [Gemmatimonadaceae bacterium]